MFWLGLPMPGSLSGIVQDDNIFIYFYFSHFQWHLFPFCFWFFMCTKKLQLNEQLYEIHLECTKQWSNVWICITSTDNNLDTKLVASVRFLSWGMELHWYKEYWVLCWEYLFACRWVPGFPLIQYFNKLLLFLCPHSCHIIWVACAIWLPSTATLVVILCS